MGRLRTGLVSMAVAVSAFASGAWAQGGESCCDYGKLRALVMQYTGESCDATSTTQDDGKWSCDGDPAYAAEVFIRGSDESDPDDADANIWFEGHVSLGGEFTLDATNAGESKLSNQTFVHVFSTAGALLQSMEFHTSCSQPLLHGDQFGSALILDCVGEDEPDPNDCCADGKPRILVMQYTGESCEATSTTQDDDKHSCDGDPAYAGEVFILASDESDPDDDGAKVWFEGQVSLGGEFALDATNAGESKLGSKTFVHVFSTSGHLLQSLEFHTSCSQPLFHGDQFGSALLIDCVSENEPNPNDCCSDGNKPRLLVMQYTGESCGSTSTSQDDDKWSCEGDPAFAAEVFVLATNKSDPDDDHAKVWFEGDVPLAGAFVIDAAEAGESKLGSETFVHVFSLTGEPLQTVEFHTSCSQPLIHGDQFGSLLLVDCRSEEQSDPTPCSIADIALPYGVLDFFDVAAFLAGFSNQDPAVDFKLDGEFNFWDVLYFLSAFADGCP